MGTSLSGMAEIQGGKPLYLSLSLEFLFLLFLEPLGERSLSKHCLSTLEEFYCYIFPCLHCLS